jgi:hypothetical protein
MKNLIQISVFFFLATGLTSCYSVGKVIEDDVYVMKSVSLPIGESLDDESSYSAYKYKKKRNQPKNEYYDGNTAGIYRNNNFMQPRFGMMYGSGFYSMGRPYYHGYNMYNYHGSFYGGMHDPFYNPCFDPFYNPYSPYGCGYSSWGSPGWGNNYYSGIGYGAFGNPWGMGGNVVFINNNNFNSGGNGLSSSNNNVFYGPRGSAIGTSGTGNRSGSTGKLKSTSTNVNSSNVGSSNTGRNSQSVGTRNNTPSSVSSRPVSERAIQQRPGYQGTQSRGGSTINTNPTRSTSPAREIRPSATPSRDSRPSVTPSNRTPSSSPNIRQSGGSSNSSPTMRSSGGSSSSPSRGGSGTSVTPRRN